MSWRDNLREASFRGVSFLYQESERSGGRRLVVHEFPRRDAPDVEDLGRKARSWSLMAVLFGTDYMAQRDALIDALEKGGVAELSHPREGTLRVRVDSYTVSESTADGGSANIAMEFVESGPRTMPGRLKNTTQSAKRAGAALNEQVAEEAARELKPESGGALDSAVQSLQGAQASLSSVAAQLDAEIAPVSEISAAITGITDRAVDLLRSPADLVHSVAGIGFSLYGALGSVRGVLRMYEDLDTAFEFAPIVPDTTPTNRTINANQRALATVFRTVNTVAAVNALAELSQIVDATANESPFESYNQVERVRDRVLQALDQVALSVSYTLFDAIAALKIEFNEHLNNHGMRLPRVRSASSREPRPLLVLAYELTGSAENMDDLRVRNALAAPMYVSAGTELEYLQ